MAELICPSCKQQFPAGQMICPRCIGPLVSGDMLRADSAPAKPGDPAESADPAESGVPAQPPAPEHATPAVSAPESAERGIPCRDPDCEHSGRVPSAGCATCGRLIRVRFPWGDTPIEPGASLVVGRAEDPLAGNLAEYLNVSRRHAEIRNDGGDLVVKDLNSANGTFINDELIPPGREVPLRGRDKVRFAADLSAEIDVSETR
jgi:hypothetical protein